MNDKLQNPDQTMATDNVFHLPPSRRPKTLQERVKEQVESSVAAHFREQNELLQANNKDLADRLQRLTTGIECLIGEMHGVRTGKKEEAFARIAGLDASPDLPTVSAEAALVYTLTASQIGEQLGFHPTQIGLLLGAKGVRWVGNGDYQEIGRTTKATASKYWHFEVPTRLAKILDDGDPEKFSITSKSVLAIYRRWKERKAPLLSQVLGSA